MSARMLRVGEGWHLQRAPGVPQNQKTRYGDTPTGRNSARPSIIPRPLRPTFR